jgi:hypothetical protein
METDSEELAAEQLAVLKWRYQEALAAGLSSLEAAMFAESDSDLTELRKLVRAGCPLEQLRAIVL